MLTGQKHESVTGGTHFLEVAGFKSKNLDTTLFSRPVVTGLCPEQVISHPQCDVVWPAGQAATETLGGETIVSFLGALEMSPPILAGKGGESTFPLIPKPS